MKLSMGAAVRLHRIAVRDRPDSLSAFKWNACPPSPEPATIGGAVIWMLLLASSPSVPDATHPVRYNHRNATQYVNEKTNLALQIVLGSSFVMFLVAAGCQFAAKDKSSDKQKGSMAFGVSPGPWMTVGMNPKRAAWLSRVLARLNR